MTTPTNPLPPIRDLLATEWDTAATSLSNPPEITTGDWSSDDPLPLVVVHGRTDSPQTSGPTGVTGLAANGMPVQRMTGTVLVDCVAGTRTQCNDVGPNGTAVNPKTVRDDLDREARRILLQFKPAEFVSLTPGSGSDIEETADEEDTEVSFRIQRRAMYIQEHRADVPS